ncbi:MAG: rod shape-determining protein MreC, partial [Nitrospina sp.]|nr:rod shape-determining protein MreC [Nitrospina sp.]
KFVPNSVKIKAGDQVLSSGLGGIFPKGLVIGTVSKVIKKKQDLFQEIILSPSPDFSKLEEVLIFIS